MAPSYRRLRDPPRGAFPSAEGRRFWWPSAVASADGFCGLLTSGHLSFLDPWGYRGCRFRPSGVLLPVSLRLERYVAAPSAPTGARRVPASDLALGNSVGAIRMVSGALPVRRRCPVPRLGVRTPSVISLLRLPPRERPGRPRAPALGSYLVDSASSHMLVSKIKPCMSKYKHSCTVKLRMAH
jgi:hypothetical protein